VAAADIHRGTHRQEAVDRAAAAADRAGVAALS